jgi:hypothetical protein
VTLLLKDTEGAPPPDAPENATEPQPDAVPRACATCGAEMAPDQDWCLSCGQAAPGRLGGRPGMRTAATVAALTLALAGGAVAASYAALRNGDDAPATSVASAPPAADVPAAATPPAATPPAATPPATPPASTPKPPKVTTPPATAAPPVPTSPSGSSSPPPASTPAPPASKPTKKPTAPPPPAGPEPIDLGADAATAYDPYSRATAQGDPVDAYDGDTGTSWKVTVPDDKNSMAVGLVVDLGAKRSVDVAEITTRTPGFSTEVYATDSKELPPDVLDTRWAHLRNATVGQVKGDKTSISLGTGKSKYRYVLLWFTKPPKEGPTVRISELSLLG